MSDASDERFLCMKGKAGLGNRMLATVTGILYAQMSGRTLVVDWSDQSYSDDGTNVFPLLFQCDGTRDALPDYDEQSVVPPIWIGYLDQRVNLLIDKFDPQSHASARIWRKHSIDLGRLDYPERVALFWSFTQQIKLLRKHFKGPWSDYARLSDDQIITRVLRDRLRLHPAIRAQVDEFRDRFFTSPMIGVHVRYMDRKTSIGDFLRHTDRKMQENPDATILLATDNKDAETTIRARYPRVVTTEKWFPEGGVSMHQNADCPDKLRNAIDALIDMSLLAECDHLVFPSSSTFSRISSLITSMPAKNIVDIDRYNPRIRMKRFIRSLVE